MDALKKSGAEKPTGQTIVDSTTPAVLM